MRLALAILISLTVNALSLAQPITGPTTIPEHTIGVFKVPTSGQFLVQEPDGLSILKRPGEWIVTGKPGRYEFAGYWIDFDARKANAVKLAFVIEGTDNRPDPPSPNPDVPPEPSTDPPIPLEGLRVLISFDATTATNLPPSQLVVIYGRKLREYLDANTPIGAENQHEWRIWPHQVDARGEKKHWQNAMKRNRKTLPWILISNGTIGFEGPLPSTVDETLSLIKKYEVK